MSLLGKVVTVSGRKHDQVDRGTVVYEHPQGRFVEVAFGKYKESYPLDQVKVSQAASGSIEYSFKLT